MGPSYDIMNLATSFGFSEIWRAQCVRNLKIPNGAVIADLMSGSGEAWTYLQGPVKAGGRLISVDISSVMCDRQKRRIQSLSIPVDVHCENALRLSLPSSSVDFIISVFGLKTFAPTQLTQLAGEMFRVLRPGGSCSLLEISIPNSLLLRVPYRFYISHVIPLAGRLFLKDIECYKMLGVYTEAFGSCSRVINFFSDAGFEATLNNHFFGCATSIVLKKAPQESGGLRIAP